ncbi:MAG: tRNA lysidine(34) synthetase TilS [Acidobacteriaceae bacterium]
MLDRIRQFIARHQLISPGDRIGAAVSGGADSVCLFRLLCELRNDIGFALSMVHFDHQLRPESADDACFVAELAASLGCPFYRGTGDVRAHAALHRQSIETAARNLRYSWFDSLLQESGLHKVATGHTQTDQAETVMMKLLRGAGPRGLSGIHPLYQRANGYIIRPLLFAPRTEIEQHLRSLSQPWITDSSNAELVHTRNRVRHQLMPMLREFNPEADSALAQTAEIMRAEETWLQQETERALPFLLLPGAPVRGGGRSSSAFQPASLALSLEALSRHPLALQRRLVRAALHPVGALSLADTERILGLASSSAKSDKWMELGNGIRVRRLHRELQIRRGESESTSIRSYEAHAMFDGTPLTLAAGAVALRISSIIPGEAAPPLSLTLRNWRPGDRFHAAHSRASKKVKEHLQSLKLTREARAQWPVLACHEEIIWLRGVPPHRPVLAVEELSQ